MKLKMTLVAALVMMVSNTSAAVFVISNISGGLLIQLADGSLANGGIVAMGYFSSAPSSNLADIADTIQNFTAVAQAQIGGYSPRVGFLPPGYVDSDPVSYPSQLDVPNALIGRSIYTFVGNSSTLSGSTQWALDVVGTIMRDDPSEQTYDALGGGLPPIDEIVDPGFNVIVSPGFGPIIGSYDYFNGSPTLRLVPEPSTALLGVFGASVLLYRRRA